jgi:hypothetical protein
MSCRSSASSSAITTMARLNSDLEDVQVLSGYHRLRHEGRDASAPSEAEWASFLAEQRALVEASDYTAARRTSLLNRLDRAASEVPNGPSFYAMRHIGNRVQAQSETVDAQLRQWSEQNGQPLTTVRLRYETFLAEAARVRSRTVPEGYAAARETIRAQGFPIDQATYTAMRRLSDEVAASVADEGERPRRIDHTEFPNSTAIFSAGYDPTDGRLEVVFRRREGGSTVGVSRTYAYHGVPASVWARMTGEEGPGSTYNRSIRNHSEYRYPSVEAQDAGAHARCAQCGQWRGASHACPVSAAPVAEPVSAREPVAEPVVESAPEPVVEPVVEPVAEPVAEPVVVPAPEPEPAPVAESVVEPVVEPEPATAPEPEPVVDPTRLPLRTTRSMYISSRGRVLNGVVGNFTVPQVTQLRAAAALGPVSFPVRYYGYGRTGDSPFSYFQVNGRAVYDRPRRGVHELVGQDLQCTCPDYQANYDCEHVRNVIAHYRTLVVPASARSTAQAPLTETEVAQAQRIAEEALERDWSRNAEWAEEARVRHAAASTPEDSYTDNFAAFEADQAAALERKRAGEEPVPFQRENALGGEFTRESGRGFGVEMEFDFPRGMSDRDKRAALVAIGQELHALGLTRVPHQEHYHAIAGRGYTDNHQGGWGFERDCTVSGEIISPIMYDEPETWENIEKVCEIVRRHGGVANMKTGSHVHVGARSVSTETATELVRMTNQHEDVMYRISQNPDASKHRPMRWCGPNNDPPQGGYSPHGVSSVGSGHRNGLNLAGVRGGDTDHPEIRYWDGSLNAAVIQAQVKVSAGLVMAAERNAGLGPSRRNRETVGSHASRLRAVRGSSPRRQLTSEELAEDTATFRSFADTIFSRREDKAQVAALFAVTNWQNA